MKAIAQLVQEHHVILEFLGQLQQAAKNIVADKIPPKEFFDLALEFAKEFADTYHHYKEEYVMFGLVAQRHAGTIDAEVEAQRQSHEQLRDLLSRIRKATDTLESTPDDSSRRLHRNVTEYAQVLKAHIKTENEFFFPLVMKTITEEEQEEIFAEFGRYESKLGDDVVDRYRRKIGTMSELL